MPKEDKKASKWFRTYNLADARRQGCQRDPAPHQSRSLTKLDRWFRKDVDNGRGGILVLPTGAGKTFSATYFLCRHPLSAGDKVLWLAHTHHLLEQAFLSFQHVVPLIAEPHRQLRVRVVSGTTGHFRVHSIKPSDDVLVCSIQTASNALKLGHPQFEEFLDSAGDSLFVVFDEAHHSPAPTYRKFVEGLKGRCERLMLLGLTATPTYTDRKKRGWLKELFPQGIIHQEEPGKLMAAKVLSQPVLEEASTTVEPEFDERDYVTWSNTYRDLPEHVIHELATNRQRNEFIASYYVAEKERFGKTIIFADRWYQCDQIREALRRRKVKADVIYSHFDADPGSAEARKQRAADENAMVLNAFRNNEIDVLINVRMLTEGTDVPDVQSVFLTRQTTSQILLTQMVGRALRGPKFGGTEKAYIVSFIDNWKRQINWATYDQIAAGRADEGIPEYGKRPPIQLISIDLVRRLARQMDSGINVNPGPYTTLLPIGWYRVEFDAQIVGGDTDDVEQVDRLVMVFEGQKQEFDRLITSLKKDDDLPLFEETEFDVAAVEGTIAGWRDHFFESADDSVGRITDDIVSIARHMAQNERIPPRFFPFADRDSHDLDAIAHVFLADNLTRVDEDRALHGEYTREDRLWKSLYYGYDLYKSHYDGCVNRILHARRHGAKADEHRPIFTTPEILPDTEPSDETKKEVKARDGNRCLCCGVRRRLTIDHISPSYYGGKHHFDNLQTLCGVCNSLKSIDSINFRNHRTTLSAAPTRFPHFKMPSGRDAKDRDKWERYVRQCINFFYRCSAVERVEIGGRGERFWHWQAWLFQGNPPEWLERHLDGLAEEVQAVRARAGFQAAPESIEIVG